MQLPSVLRAFESHSRTLAPPTRLSRRDDKSPLTASPSSRSRDLSASTLRYGAYPSASEEEATRKLEKRHRKERRELEREERRKSERARADQAGDESAVGVTAGELALLELEERELAIEVSNESRLIVRGDMSHSLPHSDRLAPRHGQRQCPTTRTMTQIRSRRLRRNPSV